MIALRNGQGVEAAAEALRGGGGQSREEELQAVVLQLQAGERRLLESRSEDARRRLGQVQSVLVLGTVLGLLIAGAAGWSLQHRNIGRGQAEEALRDSEEQYRMLLDGVQDYAIFMMDPQGRIVSWNAGAERIKGYSADRLSGVIFPVSFPRKTSRRRPPAGDAPHRRRQRPARRTRHAGAERWLRFLANAHLHRVARSGGKSARLYRVQPRSQREQGVGAKYRGLLEAAPMPWWW